MLFNEDMKPLLDIQTDSIHTKLFTFFLIITLKFLIHLDFWNYNSFPIVYYLLMMMK